VSHTVEQSMTFAPISETQSQEEKLKLKCLLSNKKKINIVKSQDGVEEIYLAGRALKESFDRVKDEGGVNLRGVEDCL
jgi:hypothetical protein